MKTKKLVDPATFRSIVEFLKDGTPVIEIAEAYGISNGFVYGVKSILEGKLSQEKIRKVICELDHGHTQRNISSVVGVTASDISTINQFKKNNMLKDILHENIPNIIKPKEIENKTTTNDSIIKLEDGVIKCGLVDGRHDIPTSKFIFSSIDSELMFDFSMQEKICVDFINENIKFENGVPDKNLSVYATGLQSVLGSIIKVCNDMKINLSIWHYNAQTSSYNEQIIYDKFKCNGGNTSKLLAYHKKDKTTYLCYCTEQELINDGEFYIITKVVYDEQKINVQYSESYLFKHQLDDNLWKLYGKLVREMNNTIKTCIFLNDAIITDTGYDKIKVISKSFNEY